ncbi:MAG: Fe-S protein assembly co-chaperone HscB [Betaproteobacteria bacterium]
MSTPTIQVCRNCGGGAPVDVHFCPQCTKILSLGRHGDYFSFLGVPRALNLDPGDLERRFRALSRQFHPDYFYGASPAERLASLERSSYLNDAYRTLRHPIARVEYLLELEGAAASNPREASRQVPPALLEEVFTLNEELDEIRELRAGGASPEELRGRLERARAPIEARREAHEKRLRELAARWDALLARGADADRRAVLESLRDCVLERNYIRNLLAGIERELNA